MKSPFITFYHTDSYSKCVSNSSKRKLGITSADEPALVPLSDFAINARPTTGVEPQRVVAPAAEFGRRRNVNTCLLIATIYTLIICSDSVNAPMVVLIC